MLQSTKGSLIISDLHTNTPTVFWKGQLVTNLTRVLVREGKVTLCIFKGTQTDLYSEMSSNNIRIKLGK